MPRSSIIYHFEQAATLEELQRRCADRIAEGWVASGEPRQFEVKLTVDLVKTRYSQTFIKHVTLPDNEITQAPWSSSGAS